MRLLIHALEDDVAVGAWKEKWETHDGGIHADKQARMQVAS